MTIQIGLFCTGGRSGNWRLTGEPGRLLPLGVRDYSGAINIGPMDAGDYVLRVTAEYDNTRLAERQLPVKIAPPEEGTGLEMTLIQE